jgi:hypothetical protein
MSYNLAKFLGLTLTFGAKKEIACQGGTIIREQESYFESRERSHSAQELKEKKV